ncbi:hypothetical protein [Streptomyces sp. NPDC093225]|uniref:hypothetical protein n=1 Tax=Streptomyces sp. NPDC093225 TaxID=3366034 RepID=UPI0037F70818
MVISFRPRKSAEARYDYRSSVGPVIAFAQALHAHLYGLPSEPPPLPAALDELLQAVCTVDRDGQEAVVAQLADQLHAAADLLEWARNHAHWNRLPTEVWERLRDATTALTQIADTVAEATPAFSTRRPPPPAMAALPSPPPTVTTAAPARR